MHLRSNSSACPNFIYFLQVAQDILPTQHPPPPPPKAFFKSVYGIHLSQKSARVGGRQRSSLGNPDIVPLDICAAGGQDILPNARRQLRDPPWARGTGGWCEHSGSGCCLCSPGAASPAHKEQPGSPGKSREKQKNNRKKKTKTKQTNKKKTTKQV